MMCLDCKWDGKCDGADCYYDYIEAEREAQDGYDDKIWYKVDLIIMCAYTQAYSLREIDRCRDPQDDIHVFMKAQDIEVDNDIKWESDGIWYQRGREDAKRIADKKELKKIYGDWAGHDRSELTAQSELGFYDELMEMAVKAGLRKG